MSFQDDILIKDLNPVRGRLDVYRRSALCFFPYLMCLGFVNSASNYYSLFDTTLWAKFWTLFVIFSYCFVTGLVGRRLCELELMDLRGV